MLGNISKTLAKQNFCNFSTRDADKPMDQSELVANTGENARELVTIDFVFTFD